MSDKDVAASRVTDLAVRLGETASVTYFIDLNMAAVGFTLAHVMAPFGVPHQIGAAIGASFALAAALLPLLLCRLVVVRRYGMVAAFIVPLVALFAVNAMATYATFSWVLAEPFTAKEVIQDTGQLRAELEQIEEVRRELGRGRPREAVADVTWRLQGTPPSTAVRRESDDCRLNGPDAGVGRPCGHAPDLRSQIAVAQEYERLEAASTRVRQLLDIRHTVGGGAALKSGRAGPNLFGPGTLVAGLLTAALAMVSGFGPLALLWPAPGRTTLSAPVGHGLHTAPSHSEAGTSSDAMSRPGSEESTPGTQYIRVVGPSPVSPALGRINSPADQSSVRKLDPAVRGLQLPTQPNNPQRDDLHLGVHAQSTNENGYNFIRHFNQIDAFSSFIIASYAHDRIGASDLWLRSLASG